MSVSGSYLAFQLRGSLPFFRIYRDSILTDALAGFVNLEERADAVSDAAFKRFGSRPAMDDAGDMSQDAGLIIPDPVLCETDCAIYNTKRLTSEDLDVSLAGSFELSLESASAEIGVEHLAKLRSVAMRLYGNSNLRCRIAPSIVVRGEAELFGLSVPRFACRVYLEAGNGSFVNVRRFAVLAKAVEHHLDDASRATDDEFLLALDRLLTRMTSPSSNCAADSLFTPPKRLVDDGYHVLTADLGAAYGEDSALLGTPYVSHLEIFGGGMCAQAVAFQATALWHNCALGIYGVSEITFLADPGDPEWIDLGGMTPDKLIRYFRSDRVNLNAQHQFVDTTLEHAAQVALFSDAMFAYVSSGIPIVLPIDLGRMNGEGFSGLMVNGEAIFERNNLSAAERGDWQKPPCSAPCGLGCRCRYVREGAGVPD